MTPLELLVVALVFYFIGTWVGNQYGKNSCRSEIIFWKNRYYFSEKMMREIATFKTEAKKAPKKKHEARSASTRSRSRARSVL